MSDLPNGLTYAQSGVDIDAGNALVEAIKPLAKATRRPGADGSLGGFGALFDLKAAGYDDPLLVSTTDGVGTKVAIAQAIDKHDTIGQDLVGMVVDDIVVVGAKPLFMTDYIACGKVVPERIADIVRGIADACTATGTALVGGETAEHPGLLGPGDYDVAGAATGIVEADAVLGADRVAVRLSPNGDSQGVDDSNPVALFTAAAKALDEIGIAFLELREPGPDGTFGRTDVPKVSPAIRQVFSKPLVLNSDYRTVEQAQAAIDSGVADAIAFGRPFISNPDLPERLRTGAPLAEGNPATWYSQGAEGYSDYPALETATA